jgi:hypothetical protein
MNDIEIHAEVRQWLDSLNASDFGRVAELIDALLTQGPDLGMPYSRGLRAGLFELRNRLRDEQRPITYWFAPDQRIVLLTTFRKQRQNEQNEIAQTRAEVCRCINERQMSAIRLTHTTG